jgi:hypothetical protein
MSRGRTPDRIRVLSLLDGKDGLSSHQIKRVLNLSDDRYNALHAELLRDGLVAKYVCRGGGLRLTCKGKEVATQGSEADRETNGDVSPRYSAPAGQSATVAQSTPVAERDARICILGFLVEHGSLSHRRLKQELNISDEKYDRVRAALVAEGLVEQTGKAGGGGLKLASKGEQGASSLETTEGISLSDSGPVAPTAEVEGHFLAERVERVRGAAKGATLTLDIAKKFLEDSEGVDLQEFTSITDDAADALAQHEGDLVLNGLISLSDAAAVALAKHQAELSLNGLTSLSDAAAAALAKHKGYGLSLNGLASLSEAAATALANYEGNLSLGMTSLSETAAAVLAKHPGGLFLNNLTNLSEMAAAALVEQEGELWLSLNGLTSLSDAAAAALVKQEGELWLSLNGLSSLSDTAAAELAKNKGGLSLKGLTSLSNATAAALAKHAGGLYLDGLTTLSEATAAALAKHEGELSLNALTSLSDAAAAALANHKGDLDLRSSLSDLAVAAQRNLGVMYQEGRGLPRAEAEAVEQVRRAAKDATLTLDIAKKFLEDSDGVDLEEFTSISDDAAAALAQYKGSLVLNGLVSLSDAAAAALAKHKGGSLSLHGLTSLSDAAAAALAKHGGDTSGDLYLDGLTSLSDAAAAALAKHKGDYKGVGFNLVLSLDGLTSLSDAAAAALAKHEGRLYLNGLTSLSDAAAAALAKHETPLSLCSSLRNLVDAAAISSLGKAQGVSRAEGEVGVQVRRVDEGSASVQGTTEAAPAPRRWFRFTFEGRGGEVVMGTITKEQYEYWSEQEDLVEYFSDLSSNNEDPEFGKIPQNARFDSEWYEYDNIAHTNGIEFDEFASLVIQEVDQDGKPIGITVTIQIEEENLIKNNIKIKCTESVSDDDIANGYFFSGYSYQKGAWYPEEKEIVETGRNGIALGKLQLNYADINGVKIIDSFEYDGNFYGYLVGNTSGKGDFFSVRAGSEVDK